MFEWYKTAMKGYANFNGRARRKEYWYFVLTNILIVALLALVSNLVDEDLGLGLIGVYWLAMFIPYMAVTVRRLHDTGRSGWHFFVYLIPFIGGIWLLVLLCTDSDAGTNAYGPNPKQNNRKFDFEQNQFAQ